MKSHFPDGQIPQHLLAATVKPAADNTTTVTAEADTSATVDDQNGDYFSGRTRYVFILVPVGFYIFV